MKNATFVEQEDPRTAAKMARAKALQAFEEEEVNLFTVRKQIAGMEDAMSALINAERGHLSAMDLHRRTIVDGIDAVIGGFDSDTDDCPDSR